MNMNPICSEDIGEGLFQMVKRLALRLLHDPDIRAALQPVAPAPEKLLTHAEVAKAFGMTLGAWKKLVERNTSLQDLAHGTSHARWRLSEVTWWRDTYGNDRIARAGANDLARERRVRLTR